MKKKYLKTIITLGVIFFASNVSATEVGEFRSGIKQERQDFRASTSAERDALRNQLEARRSALDEAIKNATTSAARKALLEQTRKENEEMRERTLEAIKAEREDFRKGIKDEIIQFKDERKVKLDETKKTKLIENLNNAFQKLNKTLANIQGFDSRIKDRITELKAKGLNVTQAESDLVIAESALQNAVLSVSATQSGIKDAIASSTSVSVEALKTSIKNTMDTIKNAKEKFKIVIEDIAKIEKINQENKNASSTEE